jgi:hypothetical protein
MAAGAAAGEPGLTLHKTDGLLEELQRLNFVPTVILRKIL